MPSASTIDEIAPYPSFASSYTWGYLHTALSDAQAQLKAYADRLPDGCESYIDPGLLARVTEALVFSRTLQARMFGEESVARFEQNVGQMLGRHAVEMKQAPDWRVKPHAYEEECALCGDTYHAPIHHPPGDRCPDCMKTECQCPLGWDGDAPDEDRLRDR